eukprot:55364-Pelagomonas_calceolata.AAC.1
MPASSTKAPACNHSAIGERTPLCPPLFLLRIVLPLIVMHYIAACCSWQAGASIMASLRKRNNQSLLASRLKAV